MIDGFLLLTPLLLLAVVALLGFVGCDQVLGLTQAYQGIGYVNTSVLVEPANANTVTAVLGGLSGGELVVVTLQWSGNAPTFSPSLTSAAGPYTWELEATAPPKKISDIQVFTAINADNSTQFAVKVSLSSVVPWSVCLTAFSIVDTNEPTYSPQTVQAFTSANSPAQTSPIGLGDSDALYAIGIAANSVGTILSALGNLGAGTSFTSDYPGTTNILVEHRFPSGGNQSLPAVVNNTQNANANLFVFGMGIKAQTHS
jgi:hypothetical protein